MQRSQSDGQTRASHASVLRSLQLRAVLAVTKLIITHTLEQLRFTAVIGKWKGWKDNEKMEQHEALSMKWRTERRSWRRATADTPKQTLKHVNLIHHRLRNRHSLRGNSPPDWWTLKVHNVSRPAQPLQLIGNVGSSNRMTQGASVYEGLFRFQFNTSSLLVSLRLPYFPVTKDNVLTHKQSLFCISSPHWVR